MSHSILTIEPLYFLIYTTYIYTTISYSVVLSKTSRNEALVYDIITLHCCFTVVKMKSFITVVEFWCTIIVQANMIVQIIIENRNILYGTYNLFSWLQELFPRLNNGWCGICRSHIHRSFSSWKRILSIFSYRYFVTLRNTV